MAPTAPEPPGNIRVFVNWREQTVFAGEDVECRITFKNVAHAKAAPAHLRHPNSDRPRQNSPLHGSARPKPSPGLAPPATVARGHRASLSLTVPSPRSRLRADSAPWSPTNVPENRPSSNGHRRSISIVSIGSASTADGRPPTSPASSTTSSRPRGHARASSLQISSRGSPTNGPRSGPQPHRSFSVQPSPLFNSTYPSDRSSVHSRPSGASTVPNTPSLGGPAASPSPGEDGLSQFKFPTVQSPASASPRGPPNESVADAAGLPARPKEPSIPTINEHNVRPAARVLSTTSVAGTPRSSGEFYSLSNNSTETLASEYVTHQPLRTQAGPAHLRPRSNLSSQKARLPEALMMGYAQIQGSFTLDGSLVNLGPFEQVKRKGVVGGQGGGVIGVETSKRESGLLRGFGWGNITSSIGELLGGGEMSSIKDMRGLASAKSVPLLSTPQSILFVDLQLRPGESKSFEYSFRLPKGLPPTHRGKAMKIVYSLVIGTQRPGGAREQQVRSVEIPFRVLGSVNGYGEILGHDLMSPYILLRDQARVQAVDNKAARHDLHEKSKTPTALESHSTLGAFLSYVDDLLDPPRDGAAGPGGRVGGLLSPTADVDAGRPSFFEDGRTTAREAIDLAILRSNLTAEGAQSANRFAIARNGRRVGVVVLARPSYRLGESVALAVDFTGAEVPCYAVHAALETAERVDPGLALRSEASVHRVTRRVYVSSSEAALFARRMVFTPTIPVAATPEFVTSGVSLEWKVRLEFVVPVQVDNEQAQGQQGPARGYDEDEDDVASSSNSDDDDQVDTSPEPEDGSSSQLRQSRHHEHKQQQHARSPHQQKLTETQRSPTAAQGPPHPLLEEISHDDRGGLVLVAAENLACESFEVAVPLRVYGAVTAGLERLERDEAVDSGLVV